MMKPWTRREFLLAALVILVVVTSFTSLQWGRRPALRWSTAESHADSTPWTEQASQAATASPSNTAPASLRTNWDASNMPQTQILAHAPGWTVFDKLYMFNGTVYIVSDITPVSLPDRKYMISNGHRVEGGEEGAKQRLPTDVDMQVITSSQAADLFGTTFDRLNGVTWLCNDPSQYMTHYYHFVAELLFGFWRAHTGVLTDGSQSTLLAAPSRLSFRHLRGNETESQWRDYAQLNQFILRAVFPALSVEDGQDWDDRAMLGVPYVLDRAILADRSAAMLSPHWQASHRPAANAFELPGAPFGSPESGAFWSPLRNTLVDLMMARSKPVGSAGSVITYISRQEWDRRMLRTEDHERLVQELHALRDRTGSEVNVVSMSKLSRVEQILLAARTTIMMGVHGNGLTALLWMQPTKRSTVMEFFAPGGFAHDYEWTARALGMTHYGFWGKESFTFPEVKQVVYTKDFHGDNIPLDGALVAKLCEERLAL